MIKGRPIRFLLTAFTVGFLLCSCVTQNGEVLSSNGLKEGSGQDPIGHSSSRFSVRDDLIVLGEWWTFLGDSVLNSLVDDVLQSEISQSEMISRLKDARRIRLQKKGTDERDRLYIPGFDASFEHSIFVSDKNAYHDTTLSLIAEIVYAYATYRTYEKMEILAETHLKVKRRILEISRASKRQDVAFDIDEGEVNKRIESIRGQVPDYLERVSEARLLLGVLTGISPEEIFERLIKGKIPLRADVMPILASSTQALANRPDIRKSRNAFAEKTQYADLVTADFFPPQPINRFFGIADDVFVNSSLVWRPALGRAVTHVDFSHVEHRIDADHAEQEQAYQDMKLTVLQAVMDVEGALVSYAHAHGQYIEKKNALDLAENDFEAARLNYKNGTGDLKSFLKTQEQMSALKVDIVSGEYNRVKALIALYKALGIY